MVRKGGNLRSLADCKTIKKVICILLYRIMLPPCYGQTLIFQQSFTRRQTWPVFSLLENAFPNSQFPCQLAILESNQDPSLLWHPTSSPIISLILYPATKMKQNSAEIQVSSFHFQTPHVLCERIFTNFTLWSNCFKSPGLCSPTRSGYAVLSQQLCSWPLAQHVPSPDPHSSQEPRENTQTQLPLCRCYSRARASR